MIVHLFKHIVEARRHVDAEMKLTLNYLLLLTTSFIADASYLCSLHF
jgi:hypothetical protein